MAARRLDLASAVFSNTGRKRSLNQDSVFHQTGETADGKRAGLFLVCDGMGGRQGGEIASRIAVDTITDTLFTIFSADNNLVGRNRGSDSSALAQQIKTAIDKAHAEIQAYAAKRLDGETKIGTTVTLAVIHDSLAYIANVGDGRAYAWREGTITQITRDHSFAAKLAEEGVIDEAEIPDHPRRKVILRALGAQAKMEVDLFEWELRVGDKLLLCTDGLWQAFGNKERLADWLGTEKSPAELSQQLVNEAKYRDGSDNISAAIVMVNEAIEC